MTRQISGFKPTGHLQLGNYVGAIRPLVQAQETHATTAFIADLHALTVPHDPAPFVVPRATHPAVAERLGDLAQPGTKMGKTNASAAGVLFLLDPPDVLRRKVRRAVTDPGTEVVYEPAHKPGVANLLEILGACTGRPPGELSGQFTGYGQLKAAVADAVVDLLRPVQRRFAELTADPRHVARVLAKGAARARERTDVTVRRARTAIGLAG